MTSAKAYPKTGTVIRREQSEVKNLLYMERFLAPSSLGMTLWDILNHISKEMPRFHEPIITQKINTHR